MHGKLAVASCKQVLLEADSNILTEIGRVVNERRIGTTYDHIGSSGSFRGGSKKIADSNKPPVKDAQKVILTKEKRTHKTGA